MIREGAEVREAIEDSNLSVLCSRQKQIEIYAGEEFVDIE